MFNSPAFILFTDLLLYKKGIEHGEENQVVYLIIHSELEHT